MPLCAFMLRWALTGLLLLLTLLGVTAEAATITVTTIQDEITTNNECSLREAITNANTNAQTFSDCSAGSGDDTIDFDFSGTINLVDLLPAIVNAGNLTINGTGRKIHISGQNACQAMFVSKDAQLTLEHLVVENGKANNGGGIFNNGILTVSNSTFSGNSASLSGGGIDNEGTLTVSNSTFSGNSASLSGGGIDNEGTLTVSNSTFSGNSASINGSGGAIYSDGPFTVSNSTFSGNSASDGGAIYNDDSLTVSNSTFSGNSAAIYGGGGGIANGIFATLNLKNTILANNTVGGDCFKGNGTINASGTNLVEDGSCSVPNALTVDPLLGPLADNGGPTQTMALNPSSPAVDTADDGICAAGPVNNLDQRGVLRPQHSHCDIGAFELQGWGVGGTVTGLSNGNRVVLQNNGGDDLTVSANGNFTFFAALNDGSDYEVTVKTQPSNPSQTCTVANGSGKLNGANVTNVSITCVTNTYAVGGTVSGLAGSGLVLQNNSGDDLAISANGSFSFPTQITDGSNYNVSVKTQPSNPNQTCAVTNGSGKLNGANVTNVSITCVTNTYTVGGTVSGLAGSGLVLQNNSGDDLAISANGSFSFPTPLTDGSDYTVTVGTQPTRQKCTVSNGNGTLAGANVTDVEVTCLDTIVTGTTPQGVVTAAITAGTCLGFAKGSTQFSVPSDAPPGRILPYGVFGFTAVGCGNGGGAITLTLTYPNVLPTDTQFWKNIDGHWEDWTDKVTIADRTVEFTIQDNDDGDSNPTVGEITDPSGITLPVPVISTLDEWNLILLGLLFIGLIGWQQRRLALRN